MDASIQVTRCVCADVPFTEILSLHRDTGLTLDQIVKETGITRGCSSCAVYVHRTLETGETSHPLLPRFSPRDR